VIAQLALAPVGAPAESAAGGGHMRYRMRQKLWSFGDDFTITDGDGNKVAHVDGRVFSIGKKLSIEDPAGKELALVKETLLSLRPVYEVRRDGRQVALVKKDFFNLLRCGFTVDVPGPNDLEATGSFIDHDYTFRRGNAVVATVSKAWFSLTDSYGVDVADGEDPWLVLAATIVIDLCCHPDDAR
jgi:uncharacterized protein YxjI